jgi:hypothetical protein
MAPKCRFGHAPSQLIFDGVGSFHHRCRRCGEAVARTNTPSPRQSGRPRFRLLAAGFATLGISLAFFTVPVGSRPNPRPVSITVKLPPAVPQR